MTSPTHMQGEEIKEGRWESWRPLTFAYHTSFTPYFLLAYRTFCLRVMFSSVKLLWILSGGCDSDCAHSYYCHFIQGNNTFPLYDSHNPNIKSENTAPRILEQYRPRFEFNLYGKLFHVYNSFFCL